MAYTPTNPPALISQGIGGVGKAFRYSSTDAASAVDAAGYFTNGYDLGMRVEDQVLVVDNDASPIVLTSHIVNAASAAGGVDVSDGVAIGSTDTD